MKRYLRMAGSVLGIVAFATLAIALVIVLRGQQASPQPVSQVFQSPIETPTPPRPTAVPTGTPTAIQRCAFTASPSSPGSGPSLDKYAFSEPQVVLTHTTAIGIVGWLPAGQELLITRLASRSKELIDLFNVQTNGLNAYGEWNGFSGGFNPKPAWLISKQAVAFADFADGQIVLRLNRGAEAPVETLATELATPFLAASPDGRRVVFLSKDVERQPQIVDVGLVQRQTLPIALPWMSPQDLLALGQQQKPIPYQAAWHPDGNRIAFYNNTGLYLVSLAKASICEIDLGSHVDGKRWAVDAQWSPNGRYLVALTTVGDPIVRFIDLTVIDMYSGETRHLDVGHQYLSAFSWDPDSRHLVVLAEGQRGTRTNQYDLYLMDVRTGDSRQMLQGYPLMFSGAYGIAWSPMGRAIAVACPSVDSASSTIAEGRLCIVSVEIRK